MKLLAIEPLDAEAITPGVELLPLVSQGDNRGVLSQSGVKQQGLPATLDD